MKVLEYFNISRVCKCIIACIIFFSFSSLAFGQSTLIENEQNIPEAKQTKLGLYITAKDAYFLWKVKPEKIRILDVRTFEEYIYVGHAKMAWNIPLAFQTTHWNEAYESYDYSPNPDFINQVNLWADLKDTILVTCRSGGRSAMAVNFLSEAGYINVYNIIDGMEGDVISDESDPNYGLRMKNGWKNSGIPWTYKIDPTHVITQ